MYTITGEEESLSVAFETVATASRQFIRVPRHDGQTCEECLSARYQQLLSGGGVKVLAAVTRINSVMKFSEMPC